MTDLDLTLPESVEDALIAAIANAMIDTGAEPSRSLAERSADRLRRAIKAALLRAELRGHEWDGICGRERCQYCRPIAGAADTLEKDR